MTDLEYLVALFRAGYPGERILRTIGEISGEWEAGDVPCPVFDKYDSGTCYEEKQFPGA